MTAAAATLDRPAPDVVASLRVVAYLAASWLLLFVVGAFALRSDNALGASNRVSLDRAVFLSASTGASAGFAMDFARPDDFAPAVRAVFVTQMLSGVLLSLAGGGILWSRLLGRRHSDARLTATALGLIAFAALLGGLTTRSGESIATAAVRGVNALANGGVLFGNLPEAAGLAFKLVLVPLSLLGSIGVVVLNDCVGYVRGRPVAIGHASLVLTLTAAVYVVGTAAMALAFHSETVAWPAAIVRAHALTWMARAWGVPADLASTWPDAAGYVVLAVAVVGTGSAGSAAALGLGWLVTAPRRLQPMIVNGIFAQAILISVTLAAMKFTDATLVAPRRLLVVLSSAMNLGLSHEPLNVVGPSLYILAAAIVAGKMLPLILFAQALRPGKPA